MNRPLLWDRMPVAKACPCRALLQPFAEKLVGQKIACNDSDDGSTLISFKVTNTARNRSFMVVLRNKMPESEMVVYLLHLLVHLYSTAINYLYINDSIQPLNPLLLQQLSAVIGKRYKLVTVSFDADALMLHGLRPEAFIRFRTLECEIFPQSVSPTHFERIVEFTQNCADRCKEIRIANVLSPADDATSIDEWVQRFRALDRQAIMSKGMVPVVVLDPCACGASGWHERLFLRTFSCNWPGIDTCPPKNQLRAEVHQDEKNTVHYRHRTSNHEGDAQFDVVMVCGPWDSIPEALIGVRLVFPRR